MVVVISDAAKCARHGRRRPLADGVRRKQVAECTDLMQLDRWFDRSLAASTIDQVFTTDD
jgi:hypothetical protein